MKALIFVSSSTISTMMGRSSDEAEDFRRMQPASCAKAHRAAENGRTGKTGFASLEHNGFV